MGTPDAKVEKLAAAVRAATRSPALKDAMASLALFPANGSDDSDVKTLAGERGLWKALVARHGFASGR